MADISKITPPGSETTYNLKDATAREQALIVADQSTQYNLLNNVASSKTANNVTLTVNTDKSVTVSTNGAATANTYVELTDGWELASKYANCTVSGVAIGSDYDACIYVAYSNNGSSEEVSSRIYEQEPSTPVSLNYTYIRILVIVISGKTISSPITFKPMITPTPLYNAGFTDYQPYSLPNTKITPELIELVDSGAKNILNTQGATISPASGDTITRNSDGTFNVSRSTSGSVSNNYVLVYINAGSYMLSGAPAGGSSEQWIMDIRTNESQPIVVGEQDTGNGAKVTIPTSDYYRLTFRLGSSYSGTQLFKPMLCTKAAWDVSQKFIPYRPTYEETVEQVAENENNISTYAIPVYTEKAFVATTYGVYEYTGVSFTVPAGEVYEFIVADRYSGASGNFSSGLVVADSSTNININSTIIAENNTVNSQTGTSYWSRQVCGITPRRNSATTYYVWANRGSDVSSYICMALRCVYKSS